MSVAPTAIEVRWRIKDAGQEWRVLSFAPDTRTVTLPGLLRGEEYDGEARAIAGAMASEWVPVTWQVATTNREGAAALPPVAAANVGSRWVSGTEVTWTASDTSATISVSAGALQIGEKQVVYNASSATISGSADEVRTVYLYYDDPRLEGGSRTLGVTTDSVASMAEYGRIFIVPLTLTFAAVGGSGSGGGDIGGGGGGSGRGAPTEEEP